jgi:hypothetical protein
MMEPRCDRGALQGCWGAFQSLRRCANRHRGSLLPKGRAEEMAPTPAPVPAWMRERAACKHTRSYRTTAGRWRDAAVACANRAKRQPASASFCFRVPSNSALWSLGAGRLPRAESSTSPWVAAASQGCAARLSLCAPTDRMHRSHGCGRAPGRAVPFAGSGATAL